MSEHTKTPWEMTKQPGQFHFIISDSLLDDCRIAACFQSEDITYERAEANAAYIVQCVNSHEALVKALNACLVDLRAWRKSNPEIASESVSETAPLTTNQVITMAEAALAKVQG